jgi:glucosamine--fructose-6-phosphate aminotransferase (isomerizing)
MCGIIGFVSDENTPVSVMLDSLKYLSYRGYDSAGVGWVANGEPVVVRAIGKVDRLKAKLEKQGLLATTMRAGIGHTRWATHGGVLTKNAHPHTVDKVSVVHNGIIDNAGELRASLEADGCKFNSDTDTEIIAQLIAKQLRETPAIPIESFLPKVLARLNGTYGLVIQVAGIEDALFVAKMGSPLAVGVAKNAHYVSSDPQAFARYTDRVIHLNDGDILALYSGGIVPISSGGLVEEKLDEIVQQTLGNFPNYMMKEIWEQPDSISRCLSSRVTENNVRLGGINLSSEKIQQLASIDIIACGTSFHAGLVGQYLIETMAGIPTNVHIASEYLNRRHFKRPNSLFIAISQSGETYDTLECVRELKNYGEDVMGVINKVGSTIAKLCGHGMYIHAGMELAVASTKAFTSQVTALAMIGVMLGRVRGMSLSDGEAVARAITKLPALVTANLSGLESVCHPVARLLVESNYAMFLARGINYPVALEGALKLREISYIPCEAYPGGEMKHGPIAMITKGTPVIYIASSNLNRTNSTIKEVQSRGADVILICPNDYPSCGEAKRIGIQPSIDILNPIINVLPLQVIAYHAAMIRGCDVDRPRNLAKSVCTS